MTRSIRHIPHSGTEIPALYREPFLLSDQGLDRERLRMTDWYTDELFAGRGGHDLVFPVSRLIVDVERFEDDEQEIMASRGMGVLYTTNHDQEPLRRKLTPEEREELLSRYYRPHHAALENLVDDALETSVHVLLIDCHSFPPVDCLMKWQRRQIAARRFVSGRIPSTHPNGSGRQRGRSSPGQDFPWKSIPRSQAP